MRRDVDERVDGLHADDGVVVREEGAEAVQPPRENEGRYKLPPLPVLHVQEAQVRDLFQDFGGRSFFLGGGRAHATTKYAYEQETF